MCWRVAEHLRGAIPAYLPTTDDDSGHDEQTATHPLKKHKGTLGKLRMADLDNIVIKQVTCPHEHIYMLSGQPAIYEELSAMFFVNGYFAVMAEESDEIEQLMLAHLQELMEDREAYGWSVVLSYHVAWLHHLEQGGPHGGTMPQSSNSGMSWHGTGWHHLPWHQQHHFNFTSSHLQTTEQREKLDHAC